MCAGPTPGDTAGLSRERVDESMRLLDGRADASPGSPPRPPENKAWKGLEASFSRSFFSTTFSGASSLRVMPGVGGGEAGGGLLGWELGVAG